MTGENITQWQKVVRGLAGVKLLPVKSDEVSTFYWCTEINVSEISEAYFDGRHTNTFIGTVGPAAIEGRQCRECAGPIYAFSRSDAISWAGLRHANVCKACRDREAADRSASFDRERRERDARIKALRYMPYREYLQTPEWKEKRDQALKRAKFSCQTCGSRGSLHVHHRTYARRGEEWSSDLIALCADCHKIFHDNGKLAENGRAA